MMSGHQPDPEARSIDFEYLEVGGVGELLDSRDKLRQAVASRDGRDWSCASSIGWMKNDLADCVLGLHRNL